MFPHLMCFTHFLVRNACEAVKFSMTVCVCVCLFFAYTHNLHAQTVVILSSWHVLFKELVCCPVLAHLPPTFMPMVLSSNTCLISILYFILELYSWCLFFYLANTCWSERVGLVEGPCYKVKRKMPVVLIYWYYFSTKESEERIWPPICLGQSWQEDLPTWYCHVLEYQSNTKRM